MFFFFDVAFDLFLGSCAVDVALVAVMALDSASRFVVFSLVAVTLVNSEMPDVD